MDNSSFAIRLFIIYCTTFYMYNIRHLSYEFSKKCEKRNNPTETFLSSFPSKKHDSRSFLSKPKQIRPLW